MNKYTGAATVFLVMALSAAAQQKPVPDTIPAGIDITLENNKASLSAVLRPLRQIAGAPEAFYTYFWEFGDGTFSFAPQPVHQFKDTGDYEIRLYATNNYDDGKAPKGKPRKIKVKKTMYAATGNPTGFFQGSDMLAMKANRMPKPGEEMVTVIGYRHPGGAGSVSGSLLMFYNEKQFSQKNFVVADARAYHGERRSVMDSVLAFAPTEELYLPLAGPSAGIAGNAERTATVAALLDEKKSMFREQHVWRVENLRAGEEKYLFLSLETTPQMIKDTNAVVTISTLFVPDDPLMPVSQYNLEMQIVASHDPNRMQLKNRRMNYRFVRKSKELSYKVQFQNTGRGPASKVSIGVAVPGMLNGQTLEITGFSPKCILCDSAYERQSCLDTVVRKDSIFFIFNNIYLKGLRQEGVEDEDSTKGFVKYRIRFSKELKKLPFSSQASIVFDRNAPVITNRSKGRWMPGISPGIIMGYGIGSGKNKMPFGLPAGSLGFSISTYAPYRVYLQAEAYLGLQEKNETLVSFSRDQRDTSIGDRKFIVQGRENFEIVSRTTMDVVPLHVRYNVTSWLGAGAGAMLSVVVGEKRQDKKVVTAMELSATGTATVEKFERLAGAVKESFAAADGALFADLNLGMVRAGPSLGVRVLQYLKDPQQRVFFYGIWRF
ncbi:PKD domain-containing protein [Chitinophaga sp. GCM10012297]|uniref:PKD domain-containing protein n=1 Tax=Chitinophaga chungangae TaxID=2821488 RepID=A0ABS3YJL4_9BACT|nr:PKD domain-containing protein [Chitinophaga chungangae]MBO9154871.1 PKD domain-containing protein [Chitinophaga chungangae]